MKKSDILSILHAVLSEAQKLPEDLPGNVHKYSKDKMEVVITKKVTNTKLRCPKCGFNGW